jgi:hypothetical protein
MHLSSRRLKRGQRLTQSVLAVRAKSRDSDRSRGWSEVGVISVRPLAKPMPTLQTVQLSVDGPRTRVQPAAQRSNADQDVI